MTESAPARPSFKPSNWGGWLAALALWVTGWLPRPIGRVLVWPLGPLLHTLARRRRKIAERNLQRCFPDWGDDQRARVVRATFASLARAVAEMAWCWAGPMGRVGRITDIEGLEHLRAAEARGKGVLLITGHFTCLEIGGRALLDHARYGGVYRPLRNEVLEWYQTRGRLRYADFMISKRNARQVVRILRRGGTVWYAPDQDFGAAQSVFAPFFGIPTATLLASHRLPALTGCAVVPMLPAYDGSRGRYVVRVLPALEDYPSEDPVADLARINALVEAQVREFPSQYWWIHRRFKTRPEGEPDFYG